MNFVTELFEFANSIENDSKNIEGPAGILIATYAKTLRLLARSCEEDQQKKSAIQARQEQKTIQKELEVKALREEGGVKMVECMGGPCDNAMIEISPNMPINARTLFADAVYILQQDNKLHFSEEETSKFHAKKPS